MDSNILSAPHDAHYACRGCEENTWDADEKVQVAVDLLFCNRLDQVVLHEGKEKIINATGKAAEEERNGAKGTTKGEHNTDRPHDEDRYDMMHVIIHGQATEEKNMIDMNGVDKHHRLTVFNT